MILLLIIGFINLGSETEAKKIAAQNFHYLGEGGQTQAFASEDGSYVLKLFKNHPRWWLPFPTYHARKLHKLQRDLNGYRLAFEVLAEESGLIFCHFAKTPFGKACVIDAKGASHTIDLGKTEFVLQKRAEPLHPSPKTFAAMKALFQRMTEKKISDHDPRLHKNIGLLKGKAVLIDPGRLVKDPDATAGFTPKFRQWIKLNYPELESELE